MQVCVATVDPDSRLLDILQRPVLDAIHSQLKGEERSELRKDLINLLRLANDHYKLGADDDDIYFVVELLLLGDPNCVFCHGDEGMTQSKFLPPSTYEFVQRMRSTLPNDAFYKLHQQSAGQIAGGRARRFVCGGLCVFAGYAAVSALSVIFAGVAADAFSQ